MERIALSKNFYLDEFTRSQTAERLGIDMRVNPAGVVAHNLRRLCVTVLQPLRDALGPVHITSGYRPPKLNRLIGGSPNSQHQYGLAADIVVSGQAPLDVALWLRRHLENDSGYDQLIHEFGRWVHVSVAPLNSSPRVQALTAVKVPRRIGRPRTAYVPGLLAVEDAMREARA